MTAAPRIMTIALAAGGTGGHVFPALGLHAALVARGLRVLFITEDRGRRFVDESAGIDVLEIPAANLRRRPVQGLVRLVSAVRLARKAMRERGVSAAVGFGGYPSLAGMGAALSLRLPTCIHEQNAVLGQSNRLLRRFVNRVALSFEQTSRIGTSGRVSVTGNPVRPEIAALAAHDYALPADDAKFCLLVLGGSQGASILSETVPAAVGNLPESLRSRVRVIQQCRQAEVDSVREAYETLGIEAEIAPFFDDIPSCLSQAHLAIARAGASTTSEVAVAGRPSILVPYPSAANDHQTANAQLLADAGGGWLLPQTAFTPQSLGALLVELLGDPDRLCRAAEAAHGVGRPGAAGSLADLVIELAKAGEGSQSGLEDVRSGGSPSGPSMRDALAEGAC